MWGILKEQSSRSSTMWKQLRAILPFYRQSELTISSHGQKTYDLPFEDIKEVMEWLGLSLIAASYQARAHIVWDSPESERNLTPAIKGFLKRDEPTFLYRCGSRPMLPPIGYYWRLMPEYPTLRIYQLEPKGE